MKCYRKTNLKLWGLVVLVVLCWIVGAGFYRDLAADNEETYKSLKILSEVIEEIRKDYVEPVESDALIEKAIQGMLKSLDPHSSFLTPEAFKALHDDTKGEFSGIGIVITMKKDMLVVISPIEGTPAYKAGIKAEDVIIKIDGEMTMDMSIEEAVKKIKGPKGTSVSITVMREGEPDPITFDLVRDDIPLESVRGMVLKPGFGYVRLSNFNENTARDLKLALREMEKSEPPLKGLILDLRDNPGGLLEQAVDVSDLFLESGRIVSLKYREKDHTQSWNATPNKTGRNYPMVVLINGGSASASEIVAGALQDHKRALIIGTPSFGKGSVQTVKPLKSAEGYGIRYTIARYYTPNDRSIQAQGIQPDLIVPFKTVEDEGDLSENGMLKEKDLKHHLAAETPDKKAPLKLKTGKPDQPGEDKSIESDETIPNHYGELNRKTLMSDSQVRRALELLVSYEIFKNF